MTPDKAIDEFMKLPAHQRDLAVYAALGRIVGCALYYEATGENIPPGRVAEILVEETKAKSA